MKKLLSIASILILAVSTTACINNLAVQDLNKKALEFAQQGDYTQAIERLKSSLDLEPSMFETHYNLAVVYTKAEKYPEAIEEYIKVVEMNPNLTEAYVSYATTLNNLAVDMKKGKYKLDETNKLYAVDEKDLLSADVDKKYTPSTVEKEYIQNLYKTAIETYEKYLELAPNAQDKAEVEQQITTIQGYLDEDNK